MFFKNSFVAIIIAASGVMSISCSGRMRYEPLPETGATLTGNVTFKKEKIGVGLIIVDAKSGGATADIEPDGRYTVHNAPVGEVTIAINMGPARGRMMGAAIAASKSKAEGKKESEGSSTQIKIPTIPDKYSNIKTSPLKTVVKQGENKFDISIE